MKPILVGTSLTFDGPSERPGPLVYADDPEMARHVGMPWIRDFFMERHLISLTPPARVRNSRQFVIDGDEHLRQRRFRAEGCELAPLRPFVLSNDLLPARNELAQRLPLSPREPTAVSVRLLVLHGLLEKVGMLKMDALSAKPSLPMLATSTGVPSSRTISIEMIPSTGK